MAGGRILRGKEREKGSYQPLRVDLAGADVDFYRAMAKGVRCRIVNNSGVVINNKVECDC